jgi:hypothetical protein
MPEHLRDDFGGSGSTKTKGFRTFSFTEDENLQEARNYTSPALVTVLMADFGTVSRELANAVVKL